MLLVGEPGIGKTRLAAEFADEAARRGAAVTWGRAWEAGGAPPYWPWIEALRPLATNATGGTEAEQRRMAPLARLLPELDDGAPASAPADPGQERFKLFDATATFLALATRDRPLVVVLDDLHAADLGSLALLHFVARGAHAARLVVVGTFRDVEARLSADAGEALARVAREGRYLVLGRLGRDDLASWLASEGRGDVDALFAATEGNPLFVVEMLRLARDRSAMGRQLPDGVRDVIRARLAALSPPARALLEAGSVLGRTIDLELAAGLVDQPLEAARDRAAEAVRAEVLMEIDDRMSFSHILIREVLYKALPAAERSSLHARVGRSLADRAAGDEAASLDEAVHHLFAAATAVPPDEAIGWARRAAARAARRLAFDDAAEILARAVEVLPSGRDTDRCDLLLELAAAQAGAGRSARGRETAVAAAALARRLGDAERLAHAALCCGATFLVAVVDSVLVGLLEEALSALPVGDSPLRARLLARLAAALQPAPDPDRPIAIARQALAMAARVADEPTRVGVLIAATSAMLYFGDPRERRGLDAELVALAERTGDRVGVLRGLMRLAFDHLELGDPAGADRAIDAYDHLSRAADLPMLRWRAPMMRAMRALMQRRWDESETRCAEAAAIAARVDDPAARVTLAMHTAGRLCASGRVDELAASLPETLELVGRMSDPIYHRSFRVGMLARVGRAEDARAELGALVHHDPPLRARPMLVFAADACLALGDAAAAPTLADLLTPLAGRHYTWSPLAMVMEGPIDAWIERLRALAGQRPLPARAPPPFELLRDGDAWVVRADTTFRLRDSRGLQILARLVAEPGREFHVTDLGAPAGAGGAAGDAGEMLDPQAIAAYKRRLDDLREAEAEALANDDPARATRAREEIEALAHELARGVGLGDRGRRASSSAERARVNVRQRLLDAISRIEAHSPGLARHLRQTLRTGAFCRYDP